MARARKPSPEEIDDMRFAALLSDFAETFSSHRDADGDLYMSHDAMAEDLVRRHPIATLLRVRALIAAADAVYKDIMNKYTEGD